jgi:chemotaxis protein methyltransferase CheR
VNNITGVLEIMDFNIKKQTVEVDLISDEELNSLTSAIYTRHGIDFSCYEPKSLKRRVSRSLGVFKLKSIHELWMRILQDRAFIYPFMDELSVGLTAMFRDPVLWRKLKEMLEKDLYEKTSLNIWHAGCSTGEEVFTMGIVLKETNSQWKSNAWATDISKNSLKIAAEGEYHNLKIAEYQRNYKEYNALGNLNYYYKDIDTNIKMDGSLIKHVNFEYHNLISSPVNKMFDISFCRNVMIYFDNQTKLNLFDKFHKALNPGGLLIIGFYDAVIPMIDRAKFEVLDIDAKICRAI